MHYSEHAQRQLDAKSGMEMDRRKERLILVNGKPAAVVILAGETQNGLSITGDGIRDANPNL